MECVDYDGEWSRMARGGCAVGLQLSFGTRGVPLAISSRLPRQSARAVGLQPPTDARDSTHALHPDVPFMSEMDEISYWVLTKRAPCLMNYDNLIKKRKQEAQCSKTVNEEVPSPRKRKKKRKLSMLDNGSVSTVKEQNVFFEVSQRQNGPLVNVCKSDSLGSDVECFINKTTMAEKRVKLQKNNHTKIHKKGKALVTSTPKANLNLRRSLRQARQTNNNAHLDNSFETINSIISNGHIQNNVISNPKKVQKVNKSTQLLPSINQTAENKRNISQRNKSKNTSPLNGQYEDLSDVSGFTANYIRSTKVQSSKTPRKIRCKSTRNLVKESQQVSGDENMIMCINKSVNTGVPQTDAVNCSTDSSQNIINLVTSKNNDKPAKLDKSTSLLKFVDTKAKSKEGPNKVAKPKTKINVNVSFQSQSSGTSRYPKRRNRMCVNADDTEDINNDNKNCIEFNNSNRKGKPQQETIISRTRSGRNISQTGLPKETSMLVYSNSTEQVSSMVSMNVANPPLADQKKKSCTSRQARAKKSVDKSGKSVCRDSLRDKSGFTACFSESDDDSVPLVQRKFFCN